MTGSQARVLGQLLLAAGVLDREVLDAALVEQRQTRERLGQLLIRRGVDPEAVAKALATQLRLEYAAPPIRADPQALRMVEFKLASRLRVVPMAGDERRLRVAMADPLDAEAIDDLQFRTGRRVEPLVASPRSVETALGAYHAGEVEAIVTRIGRPQPAAAHGDARGGRGRGAAACFGSRAHCRAGRAGADARGAGGRQRCAH